MPLPGLQEISVPPIFVHANICSIENSGALGNLLMLTQFSGQRFNLLLLSVCLSVLLSPFFLTEKFSSPGAVLCLTAIPFPPWWCRLSPVPAQFVRALHINADEPRVKLLLHQQSKTTSDFSFPIPALSTLHPFCPYWKFSTFLSVCKAWENSPCCGKCSPWSNSPCAPISTALLHCQPCREICLTLLMPSWPASDSWP